MKSPVKSPAKSTEKSRPLTWLFLMVAVGRMGVPAFAADELKTSWTASGTTLPLKTWSTRDLTKLRVQTVSEKDPAGAAVRWRGVPFSAWVDKALGEIPLEKRAQVDLVVVSNASGGQAIIPRYAIKKYPLLLAFEKDGKPLSAEAGPLVVIVPQSAHRAMSAEGLPMTTYSLAGSAQVELTSYGARFSHLLLKRRTDPAAIRGEKMFVQNCIACHASGRAPSVSENGAARSLASTGHPKTDGVPQLSPRDIRALVSYLDAYRNENGSGAAQPQAAVQSRR